MNKKQLNQFLNAELVIKLKDLGEVKQFINYCINLNLKYDEKIVSNKYMLHDNNTYAIYDFYSNCVRFYAVRSSDFKESIKIIDYDDIKQNISNESNKLTSWIK